MKNSFNRNFLFCSVGLFFFLFVCGWVRQGMFTDGVLYAAVSKNLAEGRGAWWSLTLSPYLFPHFYEQPPLMFWLQSLFFRGIGDYYWTENAYSFVMFTLSIILITLLFRTFIKNPLSSLLPAFCFLITPIVSFVFNNNLEEATLCVFDLLAVYSFIRFYFIAGPRKWIWLSIGIVAVIAAVLTKGIQGAFPFCVPFLLWWSFRLNSMRSMIGQSLLIVLATVTFFALTCFSDTIRTYYLEYFQSRLITAFSSTKFNTTASHFYLLGRLALELLIPLSVILILKFLRLKFTGINSLKKFISTEASFFFLVGLSASLPLMITLEQRGFYLATSVPFFALGLAIAGNEDLGELGILPNKNRRIKKFSNALSVLFLCTAVIYSGTQIGRYNRDKELLQDFNEIAAYAGENISVRVEQDLFEDWRRHQYLVRHYTIYPVSWNEHRFRIVNKNSNPSEGYHKVELNTEVYDLYER